MSKQLGGSKKQAYPVLPVRLQPLRSTRLGRTGGVSHDDGARGWNPFVKPVASRVTEKWDCATNKSVSSIPTMWPLSTMGAIGVPDSSSGSNGSSVQSSPINSMAWADVVKGLKSGAMDLPTLANDVGSYLPSPASLPVSESVPMVVDISSHGLPESQSVDEPGMTSAPETAHAADGTGTCTHNPTRPVSVGPGIPASGLSSYGPEVIEHVVSVGPSSNIGLHPSHVGSEIAPSGLEIGPQTGMDLLNSSSHVGR
ncbi:hypothetical protein L1987_87981 [Smallanthus sonchifolius]|nr:hypothetical protein L1987_87981 [Smallanthus sonchifolius]